MQEIDPTAWVHESAFLYGRIQIGGRSSVRPRVVMRSENAHISIGRMTNVQDFVMVHVGYDAPTTIGEFCSITHHATIHGATIEDACLIGIGATVMDDARVGRGSIVAPGAVVTEGTVIPPGSIAVGTPAKVIKQRDCSRENRLNAWTYHRNAEAYRRSDQVLAREHEGGSYETLEISGERAQIALHPGPRANLQRQRAPRDWDIEMCGVREGMLEAVPMLFGLIPATVRETQCTAQGAGYCRFEVTWKRSPRTGLVLGAAFGALTVGIVAIPWAGFRMTVLGLAILLFAAIPGMHISARHEEAKFD